MSFILITSEVMEVMNINRSRLNVLVKYGRIISFEIFMIILSSNIPVRLMT